MRTIRTPLSIIPITRVLLKGVRATLQPTNYQDPGPRLSGPQLAGPIVLFVALLFLASCSPSLENGKMRIAPIEVPYSINDSTKRIFRQEVFQPVHISSFHDSRPLAGIGEIDGRILIPATDVGDAVHNAIETALKRRGVPLGYRPSSPTIGGSVERWFIGVSPGFPTTRTEAFAQIKMDVYDPAGVVVYRGTYEGGYSESHIAPQKRNAEHTLQQAMANAIHSAISDSELWRAVKAVSLTED